MTMLITGAAVIGAALTARGAGLAVCDAYARLTAIDAGGWPAPAAR